MRAAVGALLAVVLLAGCGIGRGDVEEFTTKDGVRCVVVRAKVSGRERGICCDWGSR